MTETTVALHGVTKRYGAITAVRDLDLALHAGEVVALVGHNGAGKTTQIKMMLGLARPSAGRVELLGADPAADGFALRRARRLPARERLLPPRPHRTRDPRLLRPPQGRRPAPPRSRLRGGRSRRRRRPRRRHLLQGDAPAPRPRPGAARAPARPLPRRADQRPRPGAAPRLLCHRERARAARDDRAFSPRMPLPRLEGSAIGSSSSNRGAKIADGTLDALRAIARLPVRVRVRPAGAFAEPGWQRLADGSVETEVAPDGQDRRCSPASSPTRPPSRHQRRRADPRRSLRPFPAPRGRVMVSLATETATRPARPRADHAHRPDPRRPRSSARASATAGCSPPRCFSPPSR